MTDTLLIGAIRKQRKANKKNQKVFAAEIGWSYEKYMNFEKGKRVNVCDQDLKAVLDHLGIMVTLSVRI